jgi:hypothetical protein
MRLQVVCTWQVCVNSGYKAFQYYYLPLITCLSTLTRLTLASDFSRLRLIDQTVIRLCPHALFALTVLRYKGDSDYLKEVVSRIIAPLLDNITITFFNQLVFDTPATVPPH